MDRILKIQNIYSKFSKEDLKMLKFVHEGFINQEIFERCLFKLRNIFDQCEVQKICETVFDTFFYMLEYCPSK